MADTNRTTELGGPRLMLARAGCMSGGELGFESRGGTSGPIQPHLHSKQTLKGGICAFASRSLLRNESPQRGRISRDEVVVHRVPNNPDAANADFVSIRMEGAYLGESPVGFHERSVIARGGHYSNSVDPSVLTQGA